MIIFVSLVAPLAALLALAVPAVAADPPRAVPVPAPAAEPPSVPGGEIFGFTSSADTGNPGDRGIAFETTSRFAKGGGTYWSTTLETQLGFTVAPNLFVAASPFVTYHRIRNSAFFFDADRTQFDGISGELTWRFLPRGPSGISAALSFEPRWARVDGLSGARAETLGIETNLFIDAVVVPDRVFAAVNFNWFAGSTRFNVDGAPWVAGSSTSISGALAFQVNENLFVSVEARWLAAFSGAYLNQTLGHAVFAGPNLLYRLSPTASFNIAWTPQIAGNARGVGGNIDLVNFERHQLRAKLAVSF